MTRFIIWGVGVIGILLFNPYLIGFRTGGLISVFIAFFAISFFLLYRGYLYTSFGILIALLIALVRMRSFIESELVTGVLVVFGTIPMYIIVGLITGALIDISIHYITRRQR